MRTVAFHTLGCKSNQYDTQAMREAFVSAGYALADFHEVADIYLINTCTVTAQGDQKSRQAARQAIKRSPNALIILAGCFAQRSPEEALAIEGVGLAVGPGQYGRIVALAEQALLGRRIAAVAPPAGEGWMDALSVTCHEGRTRAIIKIQDGCDRSCSYCVIPSVRGPLRSRPVEEIAQQAKALVRSGFQEIVLTGIHLSSYGKGMLPGEPLIDVLDRLETAEGIVRVRLGSLEPGLFTDSFCGQLSRFSKLCPQFHISLQSGSDTVLARMKRPYNRAQYAAQVERLRNALPGAAVTTDLMCGFPGETQDEHQQSLDFARQTGFSRIHVFPYSRRAGTPAAAMPGQVSRAVKSERARQLRQAAAQLERRYAARLIGSVQPVLFERSAGGMAMGYTPQYVQVLAAGDALENRIIPVRIIALHSEGLMGEI